jgi:nitric oxide reductase subunit B
MKQVLKQLELVWLNLGFYVLTAAVTVVVLVYILVQVGPATESTIWLINEGREYIEAPRWADIGIVVVVLVFV